MKAPEKTRKGFLVARRCDDCGRKISIAADQEDECTLKCSECGREYRFHHRTG